MTPQRFKEIRRLLGLRIKALADKLFCNERTIRRYEQPVGQSGHRSVPRFVAETMEKWLKEKKHG